MTHRTIEYMGYCLELDLSQNVATVTRGGYEAELHELEKTCELRNARGKPHRVASWIVGDLANTAYREGLK